MTTIAGIQGESWAVIGFDSRVTEDNQKIYTLPKDSGKVFKNGNYLLGAAGDMRAINLLHHVFKPPVISATTFGLKLDKFISTHFIPELKKCFEDASYSKDGEHESQLMVIVNGTLYEIGNDFSWATDESGVYAIGSGSDYALGAMHASLETRKKTITTCKTIIRQAISISSRLDPGTSGPIHVLHQNY